ncbi:putative zinc alcohol dehydrogenase [Talaromyces proteolyticus]|uniref:Zinc alcohol dehydrogenase n=1 Tax=Talaromyces proteolyticus TaxID=1131652 RepID=A0AAD4L236_9EURO|nr:putative zinc alcohol dehydrogenase [Talaromyces proteolyticus]KAH8703089.1 putative zinc alcohol dehydrogenase [Talaromyces proteolyticus]
MAGPAPGTTAIPSTMKAWLWNTTSGGLEKNIYRSDTAKRPGQTLQSNQVLVKVISMSLNPADYKVPEMGFIYKCVVSTPASPGMDFCGSVAAVGPGVTNVKVGQLVFGCLVLPLQHGSLAEYIVTPGDVIVPIPDGVEVDHAATVGIAGQTALQVIQNKVGEGDHVFINGGSGGVGIYAIQIAKALGCQVTATCSTRNVELLKSLGADEVLDYTTVDVVQHLRKQGPLFSLCLDMIGEPDELYRESHNFLLPNKLFAQVGNGSHLATAARLITPKIFGGGQRPYQLVFFKNRYEDLKIIGDWMQQGKVKAVLDSVYEFDDAVQAYEKLKSHRARGKIVVHVSAKPV